MYLHLLMMLGDIVSNTKVRGHFIEYMIPDLSFPSATQHRKFKLKTNTPQKTFTLLEKNFPIFCSPLIVDCIFSVQHEFNRKSG